MTNSLHLRIAAFGLVAGPLAFTLGDTLRRVVAGGVSGSVDLTARVAGHPQLWLTAALLNVLASLLFIPGVAALVATARGRGSTLIGLGGYLLGAGLIASTGHAVAFYAPFALYSRAGTPRAALVALDRESESYPMLTALIVLFILGLMLGTILLLLGLRRAGRVPVWAVVAGIAFAVLGGTTGVLFGVLEMVFALLAFAPAALSLVQQRPDHTEPHRDPSQVGLVV